MRRLREMRERGEEVPPEIRARMRELFQSGALQRPGGGGFGQGGGGFGVGGRGGGGRQGGSQPSSRTIYKLGFTESGGSASAATPQAVRVRTGISDGAFTEIIEGLKEGDSVITSVKLAQTQASIQPPGGVSPFGGGRGPGGFGRGGR
jgi:hypothetical protein